VTVGAASALVAVWALRTVRRWRQKNPDEIERLRRLDVNACGRIGMGRIVELADPVPGGPAGPVLLYDYEVAGVTYQAAQDLTTLPDIAAAAPFLPGQITSVKYDPKQPTDSIIACETWCGIPDLEALRSPRPKQQEAPAEPAADEAS